MYSSLVGWQDVSVNGNESEQDDAQSFLVWMIRSMSDRVPKE